MVFRLYALRCRLIARRALSLANAGNVLRGRFGAALRARDLAAYRDWFEPRSPGGPSGLADPPRAFVFRVAHLEGCRLAAGEPFDVGLNLFDTRQPRIALFEDVFGALLDADLRAVEGSDAPCEIPLDPDPRAISRVRLQFVTPTELKSGGQLVSEPAFGILAARIRDRLSTLAERYGDGPLPLDFSGFAERAAGVRMSKCDIRHAPAERRSARTGQVHPLGGFAGEAEYEGNLTEFVPFLRAAQWTGAGRQTAWGKGEIRVLDAG
jgi:hypothetical protein